MTHRLDEIIRLCAEMGCHTEKDAPMSKYTSFKIGGPADVLITAESGDITGLWQRCMSAGLPVTVIGNGSNLLVSDTGIRGAVIRTVDSGAQPVLREGGIVECSAGTPLKRLCMFARDRGLSGLEFAYGIPGSAGGGIYMNAGAYGGQMSDALVWARAAYPDGSIQSLSIDDMDMGYRRSVFTDTGAFVISAAFKLSEDDKEPVTGRMEDYLSRRREKQPLEFPSGGSFFKRPAGNFAGALIEQSGLKGHTTGGAQVSEKHAGFIINRGGASCEDVLRLADHVISRVFADHGVELEPEIKFIGGR